MVGKVIIGTELDSKQLEKDIKSAEKELRNYEKEAEILTKAQAEAEIDLKPYQEAVDLIEQEAEESLRYAETAGEVAVALNSEKSQLEEINKKYADKLKKLEDIKSAINTNTANQTIMANKIKETNNQIERIKGFGRIKDQINDVNKGLKTTLKRVAKWGIAIFGVRSAYNAVRSAMSTLSQYNADMKNNLEYIRTSVATALKPLIESILNLVIKLLQYINYIAKAWTGKDLFASAEAYKQMQKNAQGTAKATKDIKNQLAGFDEMNVLSDTSSSSTGSTITTPSVDLTGIQGEVPEWIKWIVENKDLLVGALMGIGSAILLINLGVNGFMATGIGLIIAGIYETIMGIVAFIKDPSWENFGKIIKGLTKAVLGLALVMIFLNATNPVGWIILAIDLIIMLVALIVSKSEEIKTTLGKVVSWINNYVINPLKEAFIVFIGSISKIWNTATSNIKTSIENLKKVFSWWWEGVKAIFGPVGDFFSNTFGSAFNKIKLVFSPIIDFFNTIFGKIKMKLSTLGSSAGEIVGNAFKTVINKILGTIESVLNTPIKAINSLIGLVNKILPAKSQMSKLSTFNLPRLAKGGIVNQPSRGIPIGGAIVGESGTEGVIPLTDSQQMELLGQAIGKYITLNANIPVYVGNRQIAKEIRKINAESDFAFNR